MQTLLSLYSIIAEETLSVLNGEIFHPTMEQVNNPSYAF